MIKRFWCIVVAVSIGFFFYPRVAAVLAQKAYYEGKTVRLLVGASAGGLLDVDSRFIAGHMGKHIPGNPTVIVENVPGAGGLIAANRVYKATKPDGLTIGHFNGGLAMEQVLGNPGIEFDASKFKWIGVSAKIDNVCIFTKASGITNIQRWMASRKPVKLGATGPGGNTYYVPKVLEAALRLPIHLISGYKGGAEIRLSAEGGELDGVCWGRDTTAILWAKALESGELYIVLQMSPKPHPEFTKVPLAINLAKTDEARRLIDVGIHDQGALFLAYALPPGTPNEQVQILRRAFLDTLKDSEFLAEAKKAKLVIDPLPGEELERIVAGFFRLEPLLVLQLKKILVPTK